MTKYRINYGNGQVWDVRSKAEGLRELLRERESYSGAFLQRYEPGTADDLGCWVLVRVREVAP